MTNKTVMVGSDDVDVKILDDLLDAAKKAEEAADKAEASTEFLRSRRKDEGAQNLDAHNIGKAKSYEHRIMAANGRITTACHSGISILESYGADRHLQSPLRGK